jgi:hypothetical protein
MGAWGKCPHPYQIMKYWRATTMEEKAYKTMGTAGITSIIIGICILVSAISSGILLIVQGARLLSGRKRILI